MSEGNRLKKTPENRKSEHSIFKCLTGRIFLKLCCLELETKKKKKMLLVELQVG